METTYIYTLTDPETFQIRYVGKANNISQRYKAHLNRARKHQIHKKNWIASLRKKKVKTNNRNYRYSTNKRMDFLGDILDFSI